MALADQALSELSTALRRLLLEAGEPSTRDIAGAINYSHTTVAQVLNGARCPRWRPFVAVVTHLGGNPHEFKQLWIAARGVFVDDRSGDDQNDTQMDSPDEDDDDDERRSVLRLTRTTARDGTRSEALVIYDRQLAQEWIKSFLQDDGSAPEGM